ncbi:adenosylmethionine--8-amino-7-oxononanoate transaminase [Cryptosporangium aurantiacum]|uniref:Adenosylmethionine-8-amino-7-oxononanoate aminotransferase n=1 Tax=Cryptosporangium aurantiacum TaxID=134849 RepID=A0A1M7QUB5_9ACTN|nr:adenosylmethionine--8-amino-7-oxononanoate transaminase [Cryptosporangium aurantiacum]SHN35470.1 adenosylmethionine-8-amino-7-oxononanoate aminotransferase [Cryptosporangium aurantiacum]
MATYQDRPADELLALDAAHIWHPYAQLTGPAPVLPVVSASGVRLRLADGRELVDGTSSWWAAIHGYNHPVLNAAAADQLGRMAHVMFGGLTHPPAVELARLLVEITPAPLETVFFADSGSVAVEVAIKTALQYQFSTGHPDRMRLLTVRSGYYGDTFGAMAVCDPVNGMHHLFSGVLPQHLFAPAPPAEFDAGYADELVTMVERHAGELAAVIVEPVVQNAGGMRFYDPVYLRVLREVCDATGVLLIFDEIATGFGRTGTLFAADAAGVSPDVMAVGKAMTGGYLTMAAVLTTRAVATGVGTLMHGPTFMANPLAAAVSVASIRLLLEGPWRATVARLSERLRAGLEPARALPGVADVRVRGGIGVVELRSPVDVARVTGAVVDRGVWLRPFRNLIYTMPPYLLGAETTDAAEDANRICAAILAAAAPPDA